MIDPISVTMGAVLIEIVKIWLPVGVALFSCFKVIQWIKFKLINIDSNVIILHAAINKVKDSVDNNNTSIVSELKGQTVAIVEESKEMRADFRTFYAPMLMNQHANIAVRSRKNTKKPVDKA